MPSSPLAEALDAVGDRWTLQVVAALLAGPRRFGDLQTALDGIAPNVLSQRLRDMEARGLVTSSPYSQRPPRLAYELSAAGRDLAGAVRSIADWGARRAAAPDAGARHDACGTPLELRWWCPTCERPVGDDEVGHDESELHYA